MRRIGGVSFLAAALLSGASSAVLAQADPAGSVIEQNEQRARELDAATNPTPVVLLFPRTMAV